MASLTSRMGIGDFGGLRLSYFASHLKSTLKKMESTLTSWYTTPTMLPKTAKKAPQRAPRRLKPIRTTTLAILMCNSSVVLF